MWRGILGHDEVVERFRRTLAGGRLASTYLFVGPEGVGKRRFALELGKSLLCQRPAGPIEPCDECESCRLFAAGSHPDLEAVSLPADRATLPIALFVGDQEHRNEEGLCHWISFRPFLGVRRVAIIDDADHFSQESANRLLKTLEEPPPRSVLILIGTSLARQLPTIRSRAQVISFQPLGPEHLQQVLLDCEIAADKASAARLAESAGGSIARARELADPELWQFQAALVDRLSRPGWDVLSAEKAVIDFVQAAGSEASLRRDRLRSVIGFVVVFYRGRLRQELGASQAADTQTSPSTSHSPLLALEACLAAVEQVDRNANQALVISHWLASLAGKARPLSTAVA